MPHDDQTACSSTNAPDDYRLRSALQRRSDVCDQRKYGEVGRERASHRVKMPRYRRKARRPRTEILALTKCRRVSRSLAAYVSGADPGAPWLLVRVRFVSSFWDQKETASARLEAEAVSVADLTTWDQLGRRFPGSL